MEALLKEAHALSPKSLRLQAFLQVLTANRHRTVTQDHPQRLLPELMTEIRSRTPSLSVSDGNPDPISYREAVRFLAHRLYMRSATYRTQRVQADLAGLCPELADFVQGFLGMMESLAIPAICDVGYLSRADEARLYVLGMVDTMSAASPHATGCTASLVHAVRGRNMSMKCWDVFAHVGNEVAIKRGIKGVQWGGSAAPWSWSIST